MDSHSLELFNIVLYTALLCGEERRRVVEK